VSTSERIEASGLISAPVDLIFRLITDPQGHVDIDGSGMLVAAPNAQRLTEPGETFTINMDREPLGDVPLGKYWVTNTVTIIEPGRRLEWNVAFQDTPPIGHVYGYELNPVDDDHTEVVSYCDWSSISEEWRGHLDFPIVPLAMLQRSLEKLEQLITE
jgi:uncharacterized protein YndB with AHSA1/START domain